MKYFKIIIVFFQILTYILIHNFFIDYYTNNFNTVKVGLSWGLTVHFSLYFFSLFALISFFIICFAKGMKKKIITNKYFILSIFYILFILLYVRYLNDRPLRTLLIFFASFVGFYIVYFTIDIFKFVIAKLRKDKLK